jgi:predicted ATP-grasp superfamily ATP-dependent carboligase
MELAESYSLRRDFKADYSPEALWQFSRGLSFEAVAYTSNLENHPEILAEFSKAGILIGNNPETVSRVRNWPCLFERLRQAGFLVPDTIFERKSLKTDSGGRWLQKPVLSGGGHRIHFCDPWNVFPDEGRTDDNASPFMIQQYISGRSCSAAFATNGEGSVVLGISEQLIGMSAFGAADFRYCGNLVPLPEMLDPIAAKGILGKVRCMADWLTREYGLVGVNGIDFILKDGQLYLTEVNPRYAASMEIIETAYQLPIFQIHIESVLHSRLPKFDLETAMNTGKFYGKSYLFADKEVTIPNTESWRQRGIRDVPQSGEYIRKGMPVCTVRRKDSTRTDTLAAMMRQAAEIRDEIHG